MSVTQKTSGLLHRWAAAVGVHVYIYDVPTREMCTARIGRRSHVIEAMERLWPYLGEVKKEQFLRKIAETAKPDDPDWVKAHNP